MGLHWTASVLLSLVRPWLALSILSFPLLLPYLVSSVFVSGDDAGMANEDIWARERTALSKPVALNYAISEPVALVCSSYPYEPCSTPFTAEARQAPLSGMKLTCEDIRGTRRPV